MRFSQLICSWMHRRVSRNRPVPFSLPSLLALCLLLTGYVIPVQAQFTPLEDVVPVAELETTTDDLIRLTTSYADAIREESVARLNVNTLQRLRASAFITSLEFEIANINIQTAQAKATVLRAIVEKQLAAAEAKLEIMKKIEGVPEQLGPQDGTAVTQARSRIAQAQATVNILRMILKMK